MLLGLKFFDPQKMIALSQEQVVYLRIVPKIRIDPRALLNLTRPRCLHRARAVSCGVSLLCLESFISEFTVPLVTYLSDLACVSVVV